jgi:hypothetical protein
MPKIIYIVPAPTERTVTCNIYSLPFVPDNAAQHYREHPERWQPVGRMDSRGHLLCIEPEFHELKECEPLMAGLTMVFEESPEVVL